jgi:biotin synthase-like enzyme
MTFLKIIEMVKSLFFSSENITGEDLEACICMLVGLKEVPEDVLLFAVENRNAITMTRIIQNNVNPGSMIITDNGELIKEFFRN